MPYSSILAPAVKAGATAHSYQLWQRFSAFSLCALLCIGLTQHRASGQDIFERPPAPPPRQQADELPTVEPPADEQLNAIEFPESQFESERDQDAVAQDAVAQDAVAGEDIAGEDIAQQIPAEPVIEGDLVLRENFTTAMVIEVDGPIFGRFHWYLNQRLDLAKRQQVDLIILRLTSPGGDLEHSLQLARRLSAIDWATTVAYIPKEAISGGAIIALGCDRIYMQSGALIGDAGPIRLRLDGAFEHAEEKIVSYLVGALREVAISQGRPAALAEAMADRTAVVYQATELATGKQVYLSSKEFNEGELADKYELGPRVPEAGQNRFLTVGAARALELGLSEGVFASQADLIGQMSIDSLVTTRLQWVDKLVYTLNRPWVTGLLLIFGLVGLYLELAAPGISVAGLGAMFCFGIFFWSHALGGTSGWLEVLLFLLGIVCLACELFVLPGFGFFGLSGLALVVFSLVMASQDFIVPQDAADWSQLRVNLLIVLGAVFGVLALLVGQIVLLDSIPGLNRFRLTAPAAAAASSTIAPTSVLLASTASAAARPSLGATATAECDLRPSGKAKWQDQLLDVITEGDYIEAGSPIEILRIEGNRIIVRRA